MGEYMHTQTEVWCEIGHGGACLGFYLLQRLRQEGQEYRASRGYMLHRKTCFTGMVAQLICKWSVEICLDSRLLLESV